MTTWERIVQFTAILLIAFPLYGQVRIPGPGGATAGPATWTLVQAISTPASSVCGGTATCPIDLVALGGQALGVGNTVVVIAHVFSGNTMITPGTVMGGTFVEEPRCIDVNAENDCGYVLNINSSISNLTIKLTGIGFNQVFDIREYHWSGGSVTLDAGATPADSTSLAGFSTTPPGQPLTISGTTDLIVSAITSADNTCIGGSGTGWANVKLTSNGLPSSGASADKLNASSSTGLTWACNNTRFATAAIALTGN